MPHYYVYILASLSRTLYVGFTGDLPRRLYEHRHGLDDGFTKRYNVDRLVYYEVTTDARGDRPGDADQGVDAGEEAEADRADESRLGGFRGHDESRGVNSGGRTLRGAGLRAGRSGA
jgi:putative endonuclease